MDHSQTPAQHSAAQLPEGLIKRPDGSFVMLSDLEPRHQLAHELVNTFFERAVQQSEHLTELKKTVLAELRGYRSMMLSDHGVSVGGKEGNMALRSLCGTMMIKMTVSKTVTFGPELEAAKALIDEYLKQEMDKGGSVAIHQIITKVFKVNSKGRLDTSGILGLREHRFDDPLWTRAMDALEYAICRDRAATYVNFYRVDVSSNARVETLVPLDLAKV